MTPFFWIGVGVAGTYAVSIIAAVGFGLLLRANSHNYATTTDESTEHGRDATGTDARKDAFYEPSRN
jgi:hypothetical protein